MKFRFDRIIAYSVLGFLPTLSTNFVQAQQPQATTASSGQLTEPVYRLSKNQPPPPASAPHSLDPAIQLAHQSLGLINENISDYTAKLVKRERINNELG